MISIMYSHGEKVVATFYGYTVHKRRAASLADLFNLGQRAIIILAHIVNAALTCHNAETTGSVKR